MNYYIKIFGCRMNYSDSERIAALLEKGGFKAIPSKELADLIVVNSCGVRQTAEDRVYSFIHNIWKNNPKTKIILTGCLANRKDVQRRLKNKVNLFISIDNINLFENWLIENSLRIATASAGSRCSGKNCKLKILAQKNITDKKNIAYLSIKPKHTNKFQALVPVMTGCNNFCSYCVVPYARGEEVSRLEREIIQEIKHLIKNGYKEIVLLGQNVNSYISPSTFQGEGWGGVNFSVLLKKINALPGHFWISFISNHPKDFSDELIKTATQLSRVCEYIHLPLQAGDDQILERMNRKYTRQKYLKIIYKIKKAFQKYKPNALYSITSDIIVGFPGETKKQFLQSAEVMKKVGFDMVYFGQYSPRPGTTAYKLTDNISRREKSRREKYLNEILKKTSFANNQKYLGETLEVLVEKEENPRAKLLESKSLESKSLALGKALGKIIYFGRTRTMKNVKIISSNKNLIGKIVKAKIIKANIWNLEAKIK